MNYTKKENGLMYLLISIAISFWIGVISGILNQVFVAIAATVYCLLGLGIMSCSLEIKGTTKRRVIAIIITLVVFSIPIICLLF